MRLVNKIHHKDCIKGMRDIKDNSVAFALVDWPFNCQDKRNDYGRFVNKALKQIHRVLMDGGNIASINNPKNGLDTYKYFEQFDDLLFRNELSIVRPTGLRPGWMYRKHFL